MPSLERGEEEVKEGKGLKILTPNKLLTRLPVLSVQIKAGNNLHKETKYLLYQHNKLSKKFTTI